MIGHYNPLMVMISLAIAVLGAYTALDLAEHATTIARIAAGFALGLGIWAMHFVAMLAFELPIPVRYDPDMTLISLGVAILAACIGFLMSRPGTSPRQMVNAALWMGTGICGMHYIGMAALQMPADITYNPWMVIVSVIIAVSASLIALICQ